MDVPRTAALTLAVRISVLAALALGGASLSASTALAKTRVPAPVAHCSHARTGKHAGAHCARRPLRHTAVSYPAVPQHVSVPASSGPCIGMLDVPTAANLAEVQSATLCLINAVRAHFGVAPLSDNPKLAAAALARSRDEVANDYFDHVSPTGLTTEGLIRDSGYLTGLANWQIAENLAFGTRELVTPYAMVLAWFFSPEHRANMLDPTFKDTGIGVVAAAPASQSTDHPAATYTEEFGIASS